MQVEVTPTVGARKQNVDKTIQCLAVFPHDVGSLAQKYISIAALTGIHIDAGIDHTPEHFGLDAFRRHALKGRFSRH